MSVFIMSMKCIHCVWKRNYFETTIIKINIGQMRRLFKLEEGFYVCNLSITWAEDALCKYTHIKHSENN